MATLVKTEEFKEILRMGKVHFEYTKKDGTLREAIGTLNPELIPGDMKPKDSSTNITNTRYYDLDKNAWRSISYETKEINVL